MQYDRTICCQQLLFCFIAQKRYCTNQWSLITVNWVTRLVPLVEQERLTLPGHMNSPQDFSGVRVTRSLVLCVMFCISLFVRLSFFFWPLCCLFFFDLRIHIIPLASSNSSWQDICLYGLEYAEPKKTTLTPYHWSMFTNTSFEMHCWQEIKWCVIILTYVELVYTHYVPGEIKTKKIWSIINVISLICLSMTIMLAHGRIRF